MLKGFNGELLILDELNLAVHRGYLDAEEVASALVERRYGLNVIVTGRNAVCWNSKEFRISFSEIQVIRHPFLNGEIARKGWEY